MTVGYVCPTSGSLFEECVASMQTEKIGLPHERSKIDTLVNCELGMLSYVDTIRQEGRSYTNRILITCVHLALAINIAVVIYALMNYGQLSGGYIPLSCSTMNG